LDGGIRDRLSQARHLRHFVLANPAFSAGINIRTAVAPNKVPEQTQCVAFSGDERATLRQWRVKHMLYWAVTFFVVALIAAIMGFGGIAIAAAGIAKILFFVFLVLFLVSLVAHMSRRI
jgi:uncharacterized membrane protein YtjA (UPF0391 family)